MQENHVNDYGGTRELLKWIRSVFSILLRLQFHYNASLKMIIANKEINTAMKMEYIFSFQHKFTHFQDVVIVSVSLPFRYQFILMGMGPILLSSNPNTYFATLCCFGEVTDSVVQWLSCWTLNREARLKIPTHPWSFLGNLKLSHHFQAQPTSQDSYEYKEEGKLGMTPISRAGWKSIYLLSLINL